MLSKSIYTLLISITLTFSCTFLFSEDAFQDECTCFNHSLYPSNFQSYLALYFPGITKRETKIGWRNEVNFSKHIITLVHDFYSHDNNIIFKHDFNWSETYPFNSLSWGYPGQSLRIGDYIDEGEKKQILKEYEQLKKMHRPRTGSHVKYFADFRAMFDYLYQSANFVYKTEIAYTNAYYARPGLENRKEEAAKKYDNLKGSHKRYLKDLNIDYEAVLDAFEVLHQECKKKHTSLRTYYEDGLLKLAQGKNSEAMEASCELIEVSKKHNSDKYLRASTYFDLGVFCSSAGEYSQAIEALTLALEQDPENKDAYLERAACYFELGNIDLAIKDYLQSGFELESPKEKSKIEFAKGFMSGSGEGLVAGGKEIPVALYESVRGAGHLLWAFVKDPINMPGQMIDSMNEIIEVLRKEDLETISHLLTPELYDLVKKWPKLNYHKRGERCGFIFGKYGINFIPAGSILKLSKACQDLRRMNAACNVYAATQSTKNKAQIVKAANKAFSNREKYLKNSSQLKSIKASIASGKVEGLASGKITEMGAENLAIRLERYYGSVRLHHDSQGKHQIGHHHYENLKKEKKNIYAIWEHPEPEKMLKKTAGKGKVIRGKRGEPGCQELVDCGEIIGIHIKKHAGQDVEICRGPTTMAVIHYRKDGYAHLAPAEPIGGHIK